ncbi:MAG: DNA repair protein RadA [Actinomycetota bacterium]|nr:DNA repair protein RadA [Actinomycetota bacterium]
MVSASRSPRPKRHYVCRSCGVSAATWIGRCTSCQEWGTVEEVQALPRVRAAPAAVLRPLGDFVAGGSVPLPTGVGEVDRVLGGGIVAGSVTLLSGEPGIGKSTLTLQIALAIAGTGASVVLVTGEEAPAQVAARAARLGSLPPTLTVLDCTSTEMIQDMMAADRPQLVVVDSVQTLRVEGIDSSAGSVTQVRESATALVAEAKRHDVSVMLVGHVTKDGSLAGPRLLEHLVDTVLTFTGDRSSDLRFLRSVKHRFGPTTETGIFEMGAGGLAPVLDPSRRFLRDRVKGAAGSTVVPILAGHRPVMVEIQALTAPRGEQAAQLAVQGVATSRVRLVLAVMQQRADVPVLSRDVFVSLVGGSSTDDPGLDLAMAFALRSSLSGTPVAVDLVACAELGLAGELRSPTQLDRRLQEAYRLGFRQAVVPASVERGPTGLRLLRCGSLSDALDILLPALARTA